MYTEFGERLKKVRKEHELSQEELANKLNVTRQAVYKWETNKSFPDVATLTHLSELLDVSLDYLLKGQEDENSKKSIEKLSDPGFYLGMLFILIGLFTSSDFGILLMVIGLFTIVFFEGVMKSIKDLIHYFKSE